MGLVERVGPQVSLCPPGLNLGFSNRAIACQGHEVDGATRICEDGLFSDRHTLILDRIPAINARLAKPCHVLAFGCVWIHWWRSSHDDFMGLESS